MRKKYKELYLSAVAAGSRERERRLTLGVELLRLRAVLAARGQIVLDSLHKESKRHVLRELEYECVRALLLQQSNVRPDIDSYLGGWSVDNIAYRGVPIESVREKS